MKPSHIRLACAIALLCAIGCAVPAGASAEGIIVQRDPGLSARERAEVRSGAGVTLGQVLPLPDVELVEVPAGRAGRALAVLNADPDVQFAVPDVRVRAAAVSPDPFLSEQWALDSGSQPDIDAPEAWQTASAQGAGVTVAVVDQIVDVDHPDLAAGIDQRYRDHPEDYDFTSPDGCTASSPADGRDHGTHVAGTIAAQQGNGIGISGVAPSAKILPLRALDNCGGGELSWILEAFAFAGEHQVPIVNASFGTDPLMPASRKSAINRLIADVLETYPNTLYVVAAGNEGNDNDALPVYPCSTVLPDGRPDNLICVGMTDRTDAPVCSGNVGRNSVDLFAPGAEILSTVAVSKDPGHGYWRSGGTSTAAPLVSGAAALLKAEQGPLFSASQVHDRIVRGVELYEGMANLSVSGGRLDAGRLVADGEVGQARSGGGWRSCDGDHDSTPDSLDQCPGEPGLAALHGCPDAAPPGDDPEGDGNPGGPQPTPPPVPTPTPTPTVTPQPVTITLSAKVSRCKPGKPCKKVATVTVKLSRPGQVAVKVERQVRRRGHLVWTRVRSQPVTADARGKTLTVRGTSASTTAKYRVTATFAGKATAVSFRV